MSHGTIERSVAVIAILVATALASCTGSQSGADQAQRGSGSLYSHDDDGPFSRRGEGGGGGGGY